MSFSDDSSDPDWKEPKLKADRLIKLEHNASQSKQKYSQKFCDKWVSIFNPWLARCEDDANKPFCRACQCRLDCNRCHLQRHERTSKHLRNLEILINKGEGAARQNLSIRQERSKYYQQRKKLNSSVTSQEASELGVDSTDFIEEADGDAETAFQFVQTENAPGDQYSEETISKQEAMAAESHGDPLPTQATLRGTNHLRGVTKKVGAKKERMKLLMQIQKDKNDLMDSFKELMGSSYQSSPSKDKNHVDLFFESVSSSVKALSPKLIAETKMRVSQLICELELRALSEDVNSSGGSTSNAVIVSGTETGTVGSAYIINQSVPDAVHENIAQAIQHDDGTHYETLS